MINSAATANFINLTPSALLFLRTSIDEQKCLGIRIDIQLGGCRGITYAVDFAKEINPADVLINVDGVAIYVASRAVVFVQGMSLDYVKTPMGGGIVFENPNAKAQCNCGKSFCVDDNGGDCDMGCHG